MFRVRRPSRRRRTHLTRTFRPRKMRMNTYPARSPKPRKVYPHTTFGHTQLYSRKTFHPFRQRDDNYPPNWDDWSKWAKARAGSRCQNCGRGGYGVELHTHHIILASKGGPTSPENLVCLCERCHSMMHPHMRTKYAREHPWEFGYGYYQQPYRY